MATRSKRTRSVTCLGLSQDQAMTLGEYSLSTVGAFLSRCSLGDGPKRIAALLGVPKPQVDAWTEKARAMCPEMCAATAIGRDTLLSLGCLTAAQPEIGFQTADPWRDVDIDRLPQEVLHARDLNEIRDQGARGTCVACSFTDALEHAWNVVESDAPVNGAHLSPQHYYYECKERDGHPGPGTSPPVAARVASECGCCREETWPYNPEPDGSEGQGPPPPGAREEAKKFRIHGAVDLRSGRSSRGKIESMAACLAGVEGWVGRMVPVGMPLHESFFGPDVADTGQVPVPLPGEEIVGYHEMGVVGYRLGKQYPGGGFFIVRNSWSTRWARNSPFGPGLCMISFRHMEEHGLFVHALIAKSEAGSGSSSKRRQPRPRNRRVKEALAPVMALLQRASEKPIGALALAAAAAAALLPDFLRQPVGFFLTSVLLLLLALRLARPQITEAARHFAGTCGRAGVALVQTVNPKGSQDLSASVQHGLGPWLGIFFILLCLWPGMALTTGFIVGTLLLVVAFFTRCVFSTVLILGVLSLGCLLANGSEATLTCHLLVSLVAVMLIFGAPHGRLAKALETSAMSLENRS